MPEHTEGPWEIRDGASEFNTEIFAAGSGKLICRVRGEGLAESDIANARLIAKAPEMLEMLRIAGRVIGDLDHDAVCNGVHAPSGVCEGDVMADRFCGEIFDLIAEIEGGSDE